METLEKTQEKMHMPEPTNEHRWLQKLVGEWTYESDMPSGPEGELQKHTGTEQIRSFGNYWIVGEGRGSSPGGDMDSIITLGYDPAKGRFVGSWVGTVMPKLWVYDGELDASEKVLSLYSEGPSMSGDGSTALYKDVIEMIDDNHRTLSGHQQEADGNWTQFMIVHYYRK